MRKLLIAELAGPAHRSGGYLYNSSLAEVLVNRGHAGLLRADRPEQILTHAGSCVLLDSLWLSEAPPAHFQHQLKTADCVLFILGHYYPPANPSLSDEDKRRWLACLNSWLPLVQAVIVTGQRAQSDWLEVFPRHQIHRAAPAIQVRPKNQDSDRDSLQFMTIGAVTEAKLPLALIRSLGCLGDLQFQWVLVGSTTIDSSHYASCVRAIEQAGLSDRIAFVGELSHDETLNRLASADAYLATSVFESFGIASAEALASGLPLIGFDAGDLKFWAPDHPGCRLFSYNDAPGFTAELKRWIRGGRASLPPPPRGLAFNPCWEKTADELLQGVGS
ncbi:MAG: glycosyltransferase family 4 protein [Pseudomonadota bacterium]